MSNQNQNNQQNQGGGKKKSPRVAELEGRIAELKNARPYISNPAFFNQRLTDLETLLVQETRKPLKEYGTVISTEGSIQKVIILDDEY